LLALFIAGCAVSGGANPADKRKSVPAMKNQVLTDLYRVKPDVRAQIEAAPGYAVFSNARANDQGAATGGEITVTT